MGSWKTKKRIIISNIILFAILFGLVSINKEFFRPEFNHLHFVSILTGSSPNFIAAFIISLAFANAILSKKTKFKRALIYTSAILVFIILTLEEIIPMWGASTQYDFFDIIASALGAMLVIFLLEFTPLKKYNNET